MLSPATGASALPGNDPSGALVGWPLRGGLLGRQVCGRGNRAPAVTSALLSIPGRGPTFFLGLSFPGCLIDSDYDLRFREGGDRGEGGWTMRKGEGRGAEGAPHLLTSCSPLSTPGLETWSPGSGRRWLWAVTCSLWRWSNRLGGTKR